MEKSINMDVYKILSGCDESTMYNKILNAIDLQRELDANEQGYSYKYTIINGKVYRR